MGGQAKGSMMTAIKSIRGRPWWMGLEGERLYQQRDWLYQKYVVEGLTCREVGALEGVSRTTISKYARRLLGEGASQERQERITEQKCRIAEQKRRAERKARLRQAKPQQTLEERRPNFYVFRDAPEGYKQCYYCSAILPLSRFRANKHIKDGHDNWCRECQRANRHEQNKRHAAKRHARRTRRKALEGSFTQEQWNALCALSGGICPCCKLPCTDFTVDHITPTTWPKATNDITNIQPLCAPCNSAKRNLHATDYRTETMKRWAEQQGVLDSP